MAFLKEQWRMITFGLVCALALGLGIWGVLSGSEIVEKMTKMDAQRKKLDGQKNVVASSKAIEDKRKYIEKEQEVSGQAEKVALTVQSDSPYHAERDSQGKIVREVPRAPLLPDALPEPKANASISFRTAYQLAFAHLSEKLHARDRPTQEEIRQKADEIKRDQGGPRDEESGGNPFMSMLQPSDVMMAGPLLGSSEPLDILRQNPASVACYEQAKEIYMYLSEKAFGRHPMADQDGVSPAEEIWQAQMSLWIQQDIAAALSNCNEERARRLTADGKGGLCWVAYMPVKHLRRLSIADRLGFGGGSNTSNELNTQFTFTTKRNTKDMFVVPLEVELVVEQAYVPQLLDEFCRTGFYTPTNLKYDAVPPDPIQDQYIYGQDPTVKLTLNLEGYYFRKIFDPWIPAKVKQVLALPDAGASKVQGGMRQGGGGGGLGGSGSGGGSGTRRGL